MRCWQEKRKSRTACLGQLRNILHAILKGAAATQIDEWKRRMRTDKCKSLLSNLSARPGESSDAALQQLLTTLELSWRDAEARLAAEQEESERVRKINSGLELVVGKLEARLRKKMET